MSEDRMKLAMNLINQAALFQQEMNQDIIKSEFYQLNKEEIIKLTVRELDLISKTLKAYRSKKGPTAGSG